MRRIYLLLAMVAMLATTLLAAESASHEGFVKVKNGGFYIGAKQYKYVGTNFWYGAILASEGQGGDRARLHRELDEMQKVGIDNLRILVGGDGAEGLASHIEPTLQREPGVYNQDILAGLDYLLVELEKRGMKAVLYLNNAWEWSGGYGSYLEWAGRGKAPIPSVDGWPAYMEYVKQYAGCGAAHEMFHNHIRAIVGRTNAITGKPYSESPAIMSWQIANEPRAFSDANKVAFAQWIHAAAKLIKSIDPNHLVSTGSEGEHGCEDDINLWNEIHSFPEVDYANIHIWPYNWGWVSKETVVSGVKTACDNTQAYIEKHYRLMNRVGKPVVLEEFGYPRDGFQFTPGSETKGRDEYYKYVFSVIDESGMIAGCNFWGWGGLAKPAHVTWQRGDDYTGDPAQEEQGLNSVFVADKSTMKVISTMAKRITRANEITVNVHQLNEWVWTAPQNPDVEVAVVNDAAEAQKVEVKLIVTTDKYQPVGTYTQCVNVAAGDSTVVNFGFKAEPGFYRCTVIAAGKEVKRFNIGYEPENIVSLPDAQPDFAAFWSKARKELDAVAPCYSMTEEKDKSNKTGRVYLVKMNSLGGEQIQGYLTVPRKCSKKNRMPVIVRYMGYGSKPWYPHPDSNPDFIEFVLSTRGQGLNEPTNKFGDWVVSGLENENSYYYRGAFMDLVRALDFVSQLPEADTRNIFAEGGSQGGAFTLAACALDGRIRAAAPWIPFLSDFPDYFQIVHWPAEPIIKKQKEMGMSDAEMYRIMSYFDIKNHARNIKCPIMMGVGLQDPTCPPHTNFSGYNLISTPKSYIVYPNCGHDTEHPAWDKAQVEFYRQNIVK